MTRDEQERLAAEHVLGLLEGEERGQAERLLASDATFQAMVEEWRSRFFRMGQHGSRPATGRCSLAAYRAGLAAEPARASAAPAPRRPRFRLPRGHFRGLWDSLAFWRAFGLAGALVAFSSPWAWASLP